jgi:hypothetical protein
MRAVVAVQPQYASSPGCSEKEKDGKKYFESLERSQFYSQNGVIFALN